MSLTFADLKTTRTQAEMRAALFALLQANGFPVTSWREGDVARTLVEIDAEAHAELTQLVSAIAMGGLLETSTGDWLTLLAAQVYNVNRNPALATQGSIVLADAANGGPFVISAGGVWVLSSNGLRYQSTNTGNVTLPQGGALTLTVQAEAPGAAYNVPNGSITTLLTSLPGVTVNNPDPGSGSWVTVVGVDVESDDALRSRCRSRWPESGFGSPAPSYDLWARTAAAAITRTNVVADAAGPNGGGVTIYVAGPSGPVAAGDVSAAQAYITPRAPLTVVPTVVNTSAVAITVTATLYGKAQHQTAALAAATTALQALAAAVPVGGVLYRAAIFEALMSPTGVDNVVISAPAGDTTLTAGQVLTITVSLSWSNT